ncbi:MAG: hypothetical protein ABTR54_05585, partial [Candidatus Competibacter sp.]
FDHPARSFGGVLGLLIVIAANIAASGVDRLLAWFATTLSIGDPGPAGQIIDFIRIACIVPALRD